MSTNPYKTSNKKANKSSGLISEFLQQSQYLKSNEEKKEFISEVRTSRQFIYIGPENKAGSYKIFEKNQTQLFQSFGKANDKCQKIIIAKNLPLKQSFISSQVDDTTYQSLMNQFMGSYLQEKLNSQQSNCQKNTQPNNYFVSNTYQPITSQKQNISFNQDSSSPINNNKDSQITFSGSKQSRIMNQLQESRIVKEEYFLLDQLKKSKQQKNIESSMKRKQQNSKNSMLKKKQNLIEESYRLESPKSSQKVYKSKEKSQEKNRNFSNGKTKIQQINLVKETKIKNYLKKPHQKYEISKKITNLKNEASNNTRKNSTSFENRKFLQKQLSKQKFQASSNNQVHDIPHDKILQRPLLKKKSSLDKNLNSLKTFYLSSNKAQNLSRTQKINSIKSTSNQKKLYIQSNEDPKRVYIDLMKKEQNKKLQQERHLQKLQSSLHTKSPNKYIYQYSYKIGQIKQREGEKNNQKVFTKSNKEQNQPQNQNSTSFKKDREMIRQIKKDLTKLIQKISIAKT